MIKISKLDVSLLLLGLFLTSFATYNFINYSELADDLSNLKLIAQVESGAASRKFDGALSWSGIAKNGDLYDGDTVFANKNSEIKIKMNHDATTLVVDENALVRITLADNQPVFNVEKGSVNFKTSKKSKSSVKVRFKSGKVRNLILEKNTDIKIRQNKSGISIRKVKGTAQIESDGKTNVIKRSVKISNQGDVKEAKIKKIVINQKVNPFQTKFLKLESDGKKIYEISKSEDFEGGVTQVKALEKLNVSKLKKGKYFIREKGQEEYDEFDVKAPDLSNLSLETNSFDVKQGDPVKLKWNGRKDLKYNVKFLKDNKVIHEHTVRSNTFTYYPDKSNNYDVAISLADQDLSTSEPSKIAVVSDIQGNVIMRQDEEEITRFRYHDIQKPRTRNIVVEKKASGLVKISHAKGIITKKSPSGEVMTLSKKGSVLARYQIDDNGRVEIPKKYKKRVRLNPKTKEITVVNSKGKKIVKVEALELRSTSSYNVVKKPSGIIKITDLKGNITQISPKGQILSKNSQGQELARFKRSQIKAPRVNNYFVKNNDETLKVIRDKNDIVKLKNTQGKVLSKYRYEDAKESVIKGNEIIKNSNGSVTISHPYGFKTTKDTKGNVKTINRKGQLVAKYSVSSAGNISAKGGFLKKVKVNKNKTVTIFSKKGRPLARFDQSDLVTTKEYKVIKSKKGNVKIFSTDGALTSITSKGIVSTKNISGKTIATYKRDILKKKEEITPVAKSKSSVQIVDDKKGNILTKVGKKKVLTSYAAADVVNSIVENNIVEKSVDGIVKVTHPSGIVFKKNKSGEVKVLSQSNDLITTFKVENKAISIPKSESKKVQITPQRVVKIKAQDKVVAQVDVKDLLPSKNYEVKKNKEGEVQITDSKGVVTNVDNRGNVKTVTKEGSVVALFNRNQFEKKFFVRRVPLKVSTGVQTISKVQSDLDKVSIVKNSKNEILTKDALNNTLTKFSMKDAITPSIAKNNVEISRLGDVTIKHPYGFVTKKKRNGQVQTRNRKGQLVAKYTVSKSGKVTALGGYKKKVKQKKNNVVTVFSKKGVALATFSSINLLGPALGNYSISKSATGDVKIKDAKGIVSTVKPNGQVSAINKSGKLIANYNVNNFKPLKSTKPSSSLSKLKPKVIPIKVGVAEVISVKSVKDVIDKGNYKKVIEFDKKVNKSFIAEVTDKNNRVLKKIDLKSKKIELKDMMPGKYNVFVKDKKIPLKLIRKEINVKDQVVKKQKITPKNVRGLGKELEVNLAWKLKGQTEKVDEYKVEIFDKKNLEKPLISKVTKAKNIKFKAKKVGDFVWKVTPKKAKNVLPSKPYNLKILPPKVLKKLPVSKPIVMNYKRKKGGCYEFTLPEIETAKKYFIEIFRISDERKTLLYSNWLKSRTVCWQSNKHGRFYYRYKYFDKWNQQSMYSRFGELIFPISPTTEF